LLQKHKHAIDSETEFAKFVDKCIWIFLSSSEIKSFEREKTTPPKYSKSKRLFYFFLDKRCFCQVMQFLNVYFVLGLIIFILKHIYMLKKQKKYSQL
jgi:hypothetical protein